MMIRQHQDAVLSLMDSISDQDDTQVKNKELDNYRSQMSKNLKKLSKDRKFFENNENCPTCEQDIGIEFKENKMTLLSTDIDSMSVGLDKIEAEIQTVYNRINEIKNSNKEIQEAESEIRTKNGYIKSHNDFITHLNEELNIKKEEIDLSKTDLMERELEDYKTTRTQYVEQKRFYDILGAILNDTGIKTRVIKKYLPVINNHVNNYLKDMDFFVNFQLDENFQETIKSRHRDQFSYYSFSEGEKKRIDIALLLTWRHIASMRNSVNVNLLILDEVFDASLDQAGVDDLMKLFNILTGTNLFIISHKLDVLDDKFPRKITVEKVKNFTQIEHS